MTWTEDPLFGAAVLAASRVLGLFLAAPLFRSRILPWRLKLGFLALLAVSFLLAPEIRNAVLARAGAVLPSVAHPVEAWRFIGGEILTGALIGWTGLLVLGAAEAAAVLVSQQIGLATDAVLDPQGSSSRPALSFFYRAFAWMVLLAFDLHHALIRVAAESFVWAPPGSLSASTLPRLIGAIALDVGRPLFFAALVLALPVLAVLGIASVVQAILGRVAPDAEAFLAGMPLRFVVGLVALAAVLSPLKHWLRALLEGAVAEAEVLVRGLSP